MPKIEYPFSQDAEMGILGSILLSKPSIRAEIFTNLEEEDFHLPQHKVLFTEMKTMQEAGKKVDLILFTEFISSRGKLDEIGGAPYVTEIFTFVPSASNWKYYLEILKDKSLMRKLIERSVKTIDYATAKTEFFTLDDVLNRTQVAFGKMKKWNSEPPKTLMDHVHEKMERMQSGEPDEDLIPSGIIDLDAVSPIRKGDMPIIKAKRKAGKSILALSVLENICITHKKTGVYFSLEDRTSKVVDRIMAGVSRIPMNKHHVKKLSKEEIDRVGKAVLKISESRLIVYDDAFDLSTILNKSLKASIDYPDLAIIVVDYAQLIRVEVKKNDSREREVATISRALRLLAMETGVPIILISQVNSDGETRESRALEQDCTASWHLMQDDDPAIRKIHVEFQRNGESDVYVPVRFMGEVARVENLTKN
jgi:replicative DNA helicase